jgi:RNA polymerase sigma-70 factor, ECF subfamily
MLIPATDDTYRGPDCMVHEFAAPFAESAAESSRLDKYALIREAQRGNSAAFGELVRHYDKAVLRLAIHLTGSEHDAQDVCQEAFLNAYRSLGSFRFECSFYTWIYRIVTNRCLDYLRRRQNSRENSSFTVSLEGEERHVVDSLPDDRHANNPERDLVASEIRALIAHALEKLSPRERLVFELKHYEDLKLRVVAGILNTSEGNARHALFRATKKLRTALAHVR